MARVRMVEPVMMIGHPTVCCLTLHTSQTSLATVIEMVIADSDIHRLSLDINRTIALGLITVSLPGLP